VAETFTHDAATRKVCWCAECEHYTMVDGRPTPGKRPCLKEHLMYWEYLAGRGWGHCRRCNDFRARCSHWSHGSAYVELC
jgi:hypothetical protein